MNKLFVSAKGKGKRHVRLDFLFTTLSFLP